MNDNTINADVTMRDPVSAGGVGRFRTGDEILGRYVVQSELGQGGMGIVYRCFDKIGGVEVAVKGLPPEVSHNADEMEAVRDNFQLVSELQHPNIAGVRTLEKDAKTGDYYLVMAYARGVSLKHWLRRHGDKTHRGEQVKVLRQIAAALDYAHNAEPRHIIHRDIKPENVMVDEHGNVAVLDFGLAAQVRSSLSRVSQVVTSRSGTPAYKSPEQWLAQAQRAPSDQYSLGIIAYQMFAGELPYDSDDIEILKHAVVFDPVPTIPGESKAVNAVFAKALAKKPQERFASCGEFVAALEGKPSHSRIVVRFAFVAALALVAAGMWCWTSGSAHEAANDCRSENCSTRSPAKPLSGANHKALEAAAELLAFELASKAESAHSLIEKEPESARLFFEKEVRAFENDRRAGDSAKTLSKNVVATNFYQSALGKATALKELFRLKESFRRAYDKTIVRRDELKKNYEGIAGHVCKDVNQLIQGHFILLGQSLNVAISNEADKKLIDAMRCIDEALFRLNKIELLIAHELSKIEAEKPRVEITITLDGNPVEFCLDNERGVKLENPFVIEADSPTMSDLVFWYPDGSWKNEDAKLYTATYGGYVTNNWKGVRPIELKLHEERNSNFRPTVAGSQGIDILKRLLEIERDFKENGDVSEYRSGILDLINKAERLSADACREYVGWHFRQEYLKAKRLGK